VKNGEIEAETSIMLTITNQTMLQSILNYSGGMLEIYKIGYAIVEATSCTAKPSAERI